MAKNTYLLHRGKPAGEVGDRGKGHTVRGRAWGKAATGRNKLQEKDSKDMIHTAGYTYALYWERNGGEWGSRRGWAVRWREVHVTCKYMHVTHSTPTCR